MDTYAIQRKMERDQALRGTKLVLISHGTEFVVIDDITEIDFDRAADVRVLVGLILDTIEELLPYATDNLEPID